LQVSSWLTGDAVAVSRWSAVFFFFLEMFDSNCHIAMLNFVAEMNDRMINNSHC